MPTGRFVTDDGMVVPAVSAETMREVDRFAIGEQAPNLFQMMENADSIRSRTRTSRGTLEAIADQGVEDQTRPEGHTRPAPTRGPLVDTKLLLGHRAQPIRFSEDHHQITAVVGEVPGSTDPAASVAAAPGQNRSRSLLPCPRPAWSPRPPGSSGWPTWESRRTSTPGRAFTCPNPFSALATAFACTDKRRNHDRGEMTGPLHSVGTS
jgi:hypothetical protein